MSGTYVTQDAIAMSANFKAKSAKFTQRPPIGSLGDTLEARFEENHTFDWQPGPMNAGDIAKLVVDTAVSIMGPEYFSRYATKAMVGSAYYYSKLYLSLSRPGSGTEIRKDDDLVSGALHSFYNTAGLWRNVPLFKQFKLDMSLNFRIANEGKSKLSRKQESLTEYFESIGLGGLLAAHQKEVFGDNPFTVRPKLSVVRTIVSKLIVRTHKEPDADDINPAEAFRTGKYLVDHLSIQLIEAVAEVQEQLKLKNSDPWYIPNTIVLEDSPESLCFLLERTLACVHPLVLELHKRDLEFKRLGSDRQEGVSELEAAASGVDYVAASKASENDGTPTSNEYHTSNHDNRDLQLGDVITDEGGTMTHPDPTMSPEEELMLEQEEQARVARETAESEGNITFNK